MTSTAPLSTHGAIRDAILACGGTVGAGTMLTHVPPPISSPFGSAAAVEHPRLRAIDAGASDSPPAEAAFLDGIQRYSVAGRIGIVPIVRGYVAGAVLRRQDGVLTAAEVATEDFLVAPLGRLGDTTIGPLAALGLAVYDSTAGDRAHPLVDVQLAGRVVERRREQLETTLAERYVGRRPDAWLFVDGSIASFPSMTTCPRMLGVIKSHETQFLDGADLHTALTLAAGCRSSVFARESQGRQPVYTWYLRLWPWEQHDVLFGLIRVERAAIELTVDEATDVSRWLLAERAPLSAPDGRWDRLLYPVQQVEAYLRAQIGEPL